MITKVKATNRSYRGEFDTVIFPVYLGDYDELDGRVELPDGTLAFAHNDDVQGVGLYRELLAMDAGDNVRRRFLASAQGCGGITAPTGPRGSGLSGERGQLTCLGSRQIGWLESE